MREEYAIIESLSHEFDVKTMCEIAGVSRSGFYKWRGCAGKPPKDRTKILRTVSECHENHPSHGYRWVHAYLTKQGKIDCSADYIRRVFACLGISAQTRHKTKKYERKIKDPYPNLVFSTWETVDRPRQVIVSDMTAFRCGFWSYYELVLYFDVFTKQIIGHGLSKGKGGNEHYYLGLSNALKSIEEAREEAVGQLVGGSGDITLIHTDQGSVYTSMAYNEIIKEHNIVRSCSRAGKPTDNPVNESLNGWIKEELFTDFYLGDAQGAHKVAEIIEEYVEWYNSTRPCWSLGYKTPDKYYEEYVAGSIERADTFKNRVLDETPKFVREKLAKAQASVEINGNIIGTSDPAFY